VRTHFWDYARYADATTLAALWKVRTELQWEHQDIMAAAVSEFANGNIRQRPWFLKIDSKEDFVTVFSMFLVNSLSFMYRAQEAGTDIEPFIKAMVQLVHLLNLRYSADLVMTLYRDSWKLSGLDFPEKIKDSVTRPVISRAFQQIYDLCYSDCSRIMRFNTERLSDAEKDQFWDQFRESSRDEGDDAADQSDDGELVMESYDGICQLNLAVGKTTYCPLVALDTSEDSIEQIVRTTHRIMRLRMPTDLRIA